MMSHISKIIYLFQEGKIVTEKELNYIKTITEEKSISKAARKLFISNLP